MIVRDEEAFLENCLRSLSGFVDEIVLVDTGSVDRSKQIAQDFNVRFFEFPWNGSFADARNVALTHSTGDWNLYIDADECVRNPSRDSLETTLLNPRNIAGLVRFHPRSHYTAYPEHRLFRNREDIRFEGVIHETVVSRINQLIDDKNFLIDQTSLIIDHYGYDGNQLHKHHRNLPLLKVQTRSDPKRIYLWWQLGVVYEALGKYDEACDAWREAINIIQQSDIISAMDSPSYTDLIRHCFTHGKEYTALLNEAKVLFPDDFLLQWVSGQILIENSNYAEAISIFKELVCQNPDTLLAGLSYDSRIFRELSYDSMGLCYFRQEDYKNSAEFYRLAQECNPVNLQYKTKYDLAKLNLKKELA